MNKTLHQQYKEDIINLPGSEKAYVTDSYLNSIDCMIEHNENDIKYLEWLYKPGNIKLRGMIEILNDRDMRLKEQRELIVNEE